MTLPVRRSLRYPLVGCPTLHITPWFILQLLDIWSVTLCPPYCAWRYSLIVLALWDCSYYLPTLHPHIDLPHFAPRWVADTRYWLYHLFQFGCGDIPHTLPLRCHTHTVVYTPRVVPSFPLPRAAIGCYVCRTTSRFIYTSPRPIVRSSGSWRSAVIYSLVLIVRWILRFVRLPPRDALWRPIYIAQPIAVITRLWWCATDGLCLPHTVASPRPTPPPLPIAGYIALHWRTGPRLFQPTLFSKPFAPNLRY